MKVTKSELERALNLALGPTWQDGLPVVPAKLRLAVNSLMDQARKDLPRDPQELLTLLQKKNNRGIRKMLNCKKITAEAFAFAIRDALS